MNSINIWCNDSELNLISLIVSAIYQQMQHLTVDIWHDWPTATQM